MFIFLFILILPLIEAKEASSSKDVSFSDQTHQSLSRSIYIFSNRIDNFFGANRADDEANQSRVRTYTQTTIGEDRRQDVEMNIKANIVLPHAQKLFQIRFDTDEEENKKNEISEKKKPSQELKHKRTPEEKARDKQLKKKLESQEWKFYADTGVNVQFPPQSFVRTRTRRSYYFSFWEFRPTQEIFWFDRDGFGEQTSLTFDRPIENRLLLRLEKSIKWAEVDEILKMKAGSTLFHEFDERRAIAYNIYAYGVNKPELYNTDYEVSMNFRQLLYKNWFFFEFKPELHFPRELNFSSDTYFTFKLEVVFGSI
jgi:hypothetical protein